MAREISGRVLVKGELKAVDPLHVGSGRETPQTDLPLAVDGRGRVYIPGTSLAGSLRAWCQRQFGSDSDLEVIWGPKQAENATHLCVEDAFVLDPKGGFVEIRDHVGIDDEWGAAAHHIKFDRAVLSKDSRLRFELMLELPNNKLQADKAKRMLARLIDALTQTEIRLGGAKTRGLGRVCLEKTSIQTYDHSRQGLIAALQNKQAGSSSQPNGDLKVLTKDLTSTLPEQSLARLNIKIAWKPVGPVMVKSGADGLRIDVVPLLGNIRNQKNPLIPGSSLKGAIRSQAERILRTLFNTASAPGDGSVGRKRFLAQQDQFDLINVLFGSAARKIDQKMVGSLGTLSAADCFAKEPRSSQFWSDLYYQSANENDQREHEAFEKALGNVKRIGKWQKSTHVAIDRWTGGSAEHMLFQTLEPFGESWSDFELEVDFSRIAQADQMAAWCLLLLVMRDLASERLPIGFGGNRGLGSVQVEKITAKPVGGPILGMKANEEVNLTPKDGLFPDTPSFLRNRWNQKWQEWIDKKTSEKMNNP